MFSRVLVLVLGGRVVLMRGEESLSLLERREAQQCPQGAVLWVMVFQCLFGSISDVLLGRLLPLPSTLADTGSFSLADPVGILPSHMQERRGSEGWLV